MQNPGRASCVRFDPALSRRAEQSRAKLLNGRPFFFEIIVIDFSTGALNHGIAKPY